jgi:hypothetical protein
MTRGNEPRDARNGPNQNNYTMERSLNQWKDRLGIIASVTCAIHCAATPILLAFLPALKLTEWMASPRFHQIAAVVCVGMVSIAIWPAFRRFRDYRVLWLSSAGLGLLIAAAFILPDECCSHAVAGTDSADSHAGHNHPTTGSHNHDHATHEHSATVSIASIISPDLLASFQPWMTPIGGLMLVVAHCLNLHRLSCSNSRCSHGRSLKSRIKPASQMLTANTKAA